MGWGRERTERAERTEKLPRADSGGSIRKWRAYNEEGNRRRGYAERLRGRRTRHDGGAGDAAAHGGEADGGAYGGDGTRLYHGYARRGLSHDAGGRASARPALHSRYGGLGDRGGAPPLCRCGGRRDRKAHVRCDGTPRRTRGLRCDRVRRALHGYLHHLERPPREGVLPRKAHQCRRRLLRGRHARESHDRAQRDAGVPNRGARLILFR